MPRQDKVWKLSKALGVSEAELRGLNIKQNLTSVPESRMIPINEETFQTAITRLSDALETSDRQLRNAIKEIEELKKIKGQ